MPRIAEAARAARQDQIIAAGQACFARSGYRATTMADVAAQAGVSKGTPYLYFEVIAAAVGAADQQMHRQIEGRFAAGVAAGQWPTGTAPAPAARLFTACLYG